MTPSEIETAARRKYNSVNSSFYSSSEVYDLIYQAEMEIARETKMLEGVTTTTSTAADNTYSFPTGVLEIKRVEYNGCKLQRIDFREDDAITLANSDTTAQGTPLYYFVWAETLYLRPIPDTSSDTIRIYYFKMPTAVTSASQTLEVPSLFHMCIVDYVAAEMAAKDQNFETAQYYRDAWYNKHLPSMKQWVSKRKRGDAFGVVKDEENLVGTVFKVL